MKIGIDIRTACDPIGGKGRFTFNMVKELIKTHGNDEYLLYTNKINGNLGKLFSANGASKIHIEHIGKNKLLWHFAVIKDFLNSGGDVFFAPTSFIIPAFLPKKIRSVIVIHDLVAFLHSKSHETKASIIEKLFLRKAAKKASGIIVPSENTKRDLMKIINVPREKITVVPLAAGEEFSKAPSDDEIKDLKIKYNLPDEYILAVSGLQPRKNLSILLDAMPEITKEHPQLKLVIVGGKGWKSTHTQKKIANLGKSVVLIDSCLPHELPVFYGQAKMLVYPSLYEGFGLPALEAMTAGCPVICSNASSLPEVVESAALTFNPTDIQALIEHIKNLLEDKNLQAELIKKGKNQSGKFSWKKAAKAVAKVFINIH